MANATTTFTPHRTFSNITNRWHNTVGNVQELSFYIPSMEDAVGVFLISVILTLLRIKMQQLFVNIATRRNIEKKKKFSESAWKSVVYVPMWIGGLVIVFTSGIFPDTKACWNTFPQPPPFWIKLFYLYQLAFYCHSLYAHVVIEISRSDYWALMFHHLATIWLVFFSYQNRFHNVGLLIMVAHDTNDVIFEFGKCLLYVGWESTAYYAFFMISWIVTRLYIFPVYLIRAALYESVEYGVPSDIFPFYWVFNGFLLFLQCLHIYWFGLMLKLAYAKLKGGGLADPREKEKKKAKKNGDTSKNQEPSVLGDASATPKKADKLKKSE